MASDEQEKRLLARCAEILDINQVNSHDDFFGVGGDSLDAVEISEMLSEELGREVGMDLVLRSPTFADMLRTAIAG